MKRAALGVFAASLAALCGGCDGLSRDAERPYTALEFPLPDRPLTRDSFSEFSTEDARDERGEADKVMELAQVTSGMTVADIGAGEGYAAIREKYIDPIEQAYALCLRISTAIANEFGAHG